MRVGRAALDEDAIRLIEEHHPNIRFDWPQILKGEDEREPPGAAETEPEPTETAFPDDPASPAHAQLGSEGLVRLRARYADVLATIGRRVADPAKAEQLRTEAERLNPDAWVTADDVRLGIERYEAAFESIREALGRRRRRRRRPGGAAPDAAGAPAPDRESAPEPPESDDAEE